MISLDSLKRKYLNFLQHLVNEWMYVKRELWNFHFLLHISIQKEFFSPAHVSNKPQFWTFAIIVSSSLYTTHSFRYVCSIFEWIYKLWCRKLKTLIFSYNKFLVILCVEQWSDFTSLSLCIIISQPVASTSLKICIHYIMNSMKSVLVKIIESHYSCTVYVGMLNCFSSSSHSQFFAATLTQNQ